MKTQIALETSAYDDVESEQNADRIWHPVYFQAQGNVIQFEITMTDEQMRNTSIRTQEFTLHAMMIHAYRTSERLQ